MKTATLEKRMGRCRATQTNQTKPSSPRILRDFLRTPKHRRAIANTIVGGGAAIAFYGSVGLLALVMRGGL